MENSTKEWAATKYGIKSEEVLDFNSGACYSTIWVSTNEAAQTISKSVNGTVNGGWYDGMKLGYVTNQKNGSFRVMV